MIQEKKVAQANEDRFDLLSSLVDANEAEHGALSESELIGLFVSHLHIAQVTKDILFRQRLCILSGWP